VHNEHSIGGKKERSRSCVRKEERECVREKKMKVGKERKSEWLIGLKSK